MQHSAARTRPPEPELKNHMVAVREFDSMISAGRDHAEFDKIGAGFLGGARPAMIGLWVSMSVLMLYSFVYLASSPVGSTRSTDDEAIESYRQLAVLERLLGNHQHS